MALLISILAGVTTIGLYSYHSYYSSNTSANIKNDNTIVVCNSKNDIKIEPITESAFIPIDIKSELLDFNKDKLRKVYLDSVFIPCFPSNLIADIEKFNINKLKKTSSTREDTNIFLNELKHRRQTLRTTIPRVRLATTKPSSPLHYELMKKFK